MWQEEPLGRRPDVTALRGFKVAKKSTQSTIDTTDVKSASKVSSLGDFWQAEHAFSGKVQHATDADLADVEVIRETPFSLALRDDENYILAAFEDDDGTPTLPQRSSSSAHLYDPEEVATGIQQGSIVARTAQSADLLQDSLSAYKAAVEAGRRAAARLGRACGAASRSAAEEAEGKFHYGHTEVANTIEVTSARLVSTTASEPSWEHSGDPRTGDENKLSLVKTLNVLRDSIRDQGVTASDLNPEAKATVVGSLASMTLSYDDSMPPPMPPPRRLIEDVLGVGTGAG